MKEIILIWFHLLALTNSKLCSSSSGLTCCVGFVWDEIENTCLPSVVRLCKDGYYGLKCRLRCPFPHFGEGCVLACNCSKELCHHVHGCKTTQGPGNHNTLNQTYRYSPLKVDLTSVSQLDNSEDRDQKFTKSFVHKNDTVEFHQQESTTYLLRTAVVGLTFVVAVLFVSYLCLTYFMKRKRASHEDLIIINE